MKPVAVLSVEDNAGDVTLIRHALKILPFAIDLKIAADGEVALKMLADADYKPDLIIIDLNLPKIDGHTVLARMARRDIPMVVFSSSADPAEIRRALALGARQFVNKPGDLESFMNAVSGIVLRWIATPMGGPPRVTVT